LDKKFILDNNGVQPAKVLTEVPYFVPKEPYKRRAFDLVESTLGKEDPSLDT